MSRKIAFLIQLSLKVDQTLALLLHSLRVGEEFSPEQGDAYEMGFVRVRGADTYKVNRISFVLERQNNEELKN